MAGVFHGVSLGPVEDKQKLRTHPVLPWTFPEGLSTCILSYLSIIYSRIEFVTRSLSFKIYVHTVFARSDAAATICFIVRFCAATIRERRLSLYHCWTPLKSRNPTPSQMKKKMKTS